MTQYLPDNLLALFAARPPIDFKPPPDELLVNRKRPPMQGVSEYVKLFEPPTEVPPKPVVETKKEKKERLVRRMAEPSRQLGLNSYDCGRFQRKEKQELMAYKIEQGIAMWAPAENPEATQDPYKTLYVSRINYETSESKLRREFERYGKIQKIVMPHDKNGKPRGYAFIEYSHKSEMTAAYKKADGMKIDGRRVVVDYERGRTQKKWLPRRLGGGKGDTRRTRLSKAELLAESYARKENGRSPDRYHGGGGGGGYRGGSGGYSGGSSSGYVGGGGGYDRSRERDRDRGDRDRDRDSRHRSDSRDRDRDRERERGGGDRDRERHGSSHRESVDRHRRV